MQFILSNLVVLVVLVVEVFTIAELINIIELLAKLILTYRRISYKNLLQPGYIL